MTKLANIEFQADRDITRGNKIPLNQLFSITNLSQEFELFENVESDKTRIKVNIDKVGSFQCKADSSRKKGEKSAFWILLQRDDCARKIVATGDIKKGEKLMVSLEKS